MINDFISNAALLIASFFVMGQLFKNRPLQPSSPNATKIYWGIFYGLLGNVLMQFSIQINATTIADLRHLAIVLAAAFGGFVPAIIASVLVSLGRLLLFDITSTAIMASIGMFVIAVICGGISKLNYHPTIKAFVMNLFGLLIITFVLVMNVTDSTVLKQLLITHYIISLIGGFIAYHFSMYLAKSNEAQQELKRSMMKLKETEERFRLIAENSSDMITMHRANGEYIYISPAVKEIVRYEYPELLGKKMEELIHPDDYEETLTQFSKAVNAGGAEATYRYRSRSGDYIWLESTMKSVPYQEEGHKRVIIVSRNIHDRKQTEQKMHEANELLNRLSYQDGLTGIFNRRYFDNTIEKEWSNCFLTQSPLTLIMFDLDYFKKYNDTYGHLAGDLCLQTVAQEINQLMTPGSGYSFCRYGGEEFAVILPLTNGSDGEKFALQIKEKVQSLQIPHSSSQIADIVTLSIGMASLVPSSTNGHQDLIHEADSALYRSKTNGRNTISVYY
jgi:diguanylate cyclase (GGDEF)-like protein/PAS domain S-box-containing protein